MRKSHYIFIGFCVAWVSIVMIYTSDSQQETSAARTFGQALGSLLIPAIIYGVILVINDYINKRIDSKLKKTSI